MKINTFLKIHLLFILNLSQTFHKLKIPVSINFKFLMRRKTYNSPLPSKINQIILDRDLSFFIGDGRTSAEGSGYGGPRTKKIIEILTLGLCTVEILDTRTYLQEILYNGNIIRLCNWSITFIGDLRWPLVMMTSQAWLTFGLILGS